MARDTASDDLRRALLVVTFVSIAVAVVLTASVGASGEAPLRYVAEPGDRVLSDRSLATASCEASPQTVEPGEEVTLDASETTNASFVEFDKEPDGTYEKSDETDFVVTVTYDEPGTYEPEVRATEGEQTSTDVCGTVTVGENEPPTAAFTPDPQESQVGEEVTFDASNSTDSDGQIVEYRWDFDGDGTVDTSTSQPATTHTYGTPDLYNARLTVVDDDGATALTSRDVRVERSEPEPRCTAEPREVSTGEEVTLDASDSTGADFVEFDKEPDGTYEKGDETDFVVTVTYDEPGTYEPRVRVWNYTRDETSATADCPTVTVTENEPPVPSISHQPRPAIAGSSVTLDASNSRDPDGQVVEYRWDFDDDGTVDNVTTQPTTTHSFPFNATGPGIAVVRLTVVDDDNATAVTDHTIDVVRRDPIPACSIRPEAVEPGDGVTIDASESERVVFVRFDVDGDGEYERADETDFRETVVYDEPGEYDVRVEVTSPSGGTVTTDCGDVPVDRENVPPVAVLTHDPLFPAPGTTVRLDASNSTDPDGQVVEYRWDVDDDGSVEDVTTGPTNTRAFGSPGNYTVRLVVVDDDNATDAAVDTVRVVVPNDGDGNGSDDDESESGLPLWPLVPGGLAGGGLLGYALCRGRDEDPGGAGTVVRALPKGWPFGGSGRGIEAQATGTFETPAGSGSVTVGGVGFDPDVLTFTVASNDSTSRTPDRSDGWSYGKAIRHEDGTVAQNAVSVADDARSVDAATGTVTDDGAVAVLLHDDEGTQTLLGCVEGTTADGFEMSFDAPATLDDERYTVVFQAFAVADSADVAVGHAPIPDESETQSIPIGFEADYAAVTTTDGVRDVDEPATTDSAVGVSHGTAVATENGPVQQVVASSVDADRVDRNSYAASGDRAVHLLGPPEGDPEARTAARLTSLDGRLELDYDEVATDGLVTFLAVDTGDEGRPAVGHFDVPAPDGDDRMTVDVGFAPSVVEFTACNVDAVGGTRTVDESPLAFGWSHGSALLTDDGVDQHMLHGGYDAADPTGPDSPTDEADGTAVDRPGRREGRADGGRPARVSTADSNSSGGDTDPPGGDTDATGPTFGGSSDAAAAVLAVGADGHVLGRDEVRVTGTTPTGFEVEVTDFSTHERGDLAERRPVVFYTAWPRPEGSR